MQNNFILMRHAEGIHNQKKKQMKLIDGNYKDKKQFKAMKFSKQLIDPKQIEINPNYRLSQNININQISLVLVSPLRRCLQTAKYIKKQFKQLGKQVQFIVQPFLASRLCSAWALGSFIQQLQNEYHQFIFNIQDNYWPLDLLKNHNFTINIEKKQTIKQQLLLHLKEGKHQSFQDLNKRILSLKQKIYKHKQKCKGKILIVSHSCLLKALCTKKYYENGKNKDQIKFQHMMPIYADENFNVQMNPLPKL